MTLEEILANTIVRWEDQILPAMPNPESLRVEDLGEMANMVRSALVALLAQALRENGTHAYAAERSDGAIGYLSTRPQKRVLVLDDPSRADRPGAARWKR